MKKFLYDNSIKISLLGIVMLFGSVILRSTRFVVLSKTIFSLAVVILWSNLIFINRKNCTTSKMRITIFMMLMISVLSTIKFVFDIDSIYFSTAICLILIANILFMSIKKD